MPHNQKQQAMALKYKLILAHLFLFAFIISVSHCDENVPLVNGLNRSSFPSHFVFGAATSAYQVSDVIAMN